MSLHGCNDPSIMTSLTGYSELLNDTYPVMKDPPLVEQESEIAYRILQKSHGVVRSESKSVLGSGTGKNDPEFVNGLRYEAEGVVPSYASCQATIDSRPNREIRLCSPNDDVGVEQNFHSPRPA